MSDPRQILEKLAPNVRTILTNGIAAVHNSTTHQDRKALERAEANRELKLISSRELNELIRQATAQAGLWGRIDISIGVEDGELKTVESGLKRFYKKTRR